MNGILYSVATPIGNLEDMTPRAIKTLENVDYILCEDTRVSSKLLSKFDITKKLIAYHKFNEKEQTNKIISDLKNGLSIALISDAGTPCISDPGRILINELHKNNIKVSPISGACAISTFLSAIPKNDEPYIFTGFIPRSTKEQEEFFKKYLYADLIFYESPNRIIKTIENIIKILGKDTQITIGRELTKLYEEIITDTAENLLKKFTTSTPKGEFVVIIYKKNEPKTQEIKDLESKITILKEKGYSTKDISIILSSLFDVNKNTIYNLISKRE